VRPGKGGERLLGGGVREGGKGAVRRGRAWWWRGIKVNNALGLWRI